MHFIWSNQASADHNFLAEIITSNISAEFAKMSHDGNFA